MKAYQVWYTFRTEIEAIEAYKGWALQEGFIGGRVYSQRTRYGQVEWVFQGFFPIYHDLPYGPTECEGMSVVELMDSMLATVRAYQLPSPVFQYTSNDLDIEDAPHLLVGLAQLHGFVGGQIEDKGGRAVVRAYFDSPIEEDWPVVPCLPEGCKRPQRVTVAKVGTWDNTVKNLKDRYLAEAVVCYLDTWYPNIPDTIQVSTLA